LEEDCYNWGVTTPTPTPATKLTCTQCGGELHPEEGELFVTCPFCGSTVYIDKARVVFHWYLASTIDENEAKAALARWMAGNDTVKDLDKKSRLIGMNFEYFPIWYFKVKNGDQERIYIEPAAATSISELRSLMLPAGDLRKYEASVDSAATQPTVPLEAAQAWLAQRNVDPVQVAESALVHIPIYTFKYAFQDRIYTAVVEAATGRALANIFPAKAEAPYLAVGCAGALAFLCLATFPVIGMMSSDPSGVGIGTLACVGLGLPVGIALFIAASWVASKV
jgi:predicted RNA-binding Zn-ribbon protein involved in translation (DUF1610 family)